MRRPLEEEPGASVEDSVEEVTLVGLVTVA